MLLFEHAGHGEHFGITPAEVRSFLCGVGLRIHLLDGELRRGTPTILPPTPNVVACRDVDGGAGASDTPGGAPAVPPVRVDVDYAPVHH